VSFHTLLELAPDAVVVSDGDGRITVVNQQTEILFGYSRDDLLGRPIEQLVPERFHVAHRRRRLAYYAHPRMRPMGRHLELVGRRQDGSEFPIDVSLAPLDLAGKLQVISTIRDITERRRTEDALRDAQQEAVTRARELEVIFEAMADGVVVYDAAGHIVKKNRAAHALFGTQPQSEVLALPVQERVACYAPRDERGQPLPWQQWPVLRALRGEVLMGQDAMDLRVRSLHGHDRQLNVSGAPLRSAAGDIVGAVCVFRDVTDQRTEAEARLHLLQTIVQELPCAVSLVQGPDARLVLANRSGAEVWGAPWSEGQPLKAFLEEIGTRILDASGLPLPADQWPILRATQRGDVVHQQQTVLRHADGMTLPMLVNAVPLDPHAQGRGGAASGPLVLSVHEDVTAIKEAERLKDEFVALAAHELRNPMTAIKANVQLLTRRAKRGDLQTSDRWRGPLQSLQQATDRLAQLTDDLLDVTRLQAGHLELHREPQDVVVLVRRIVQQQQLTTDHHTLTMATNADPVIVDMDVQRIEQVLVNLVNNAMKYSPEGGEIMIAVRERGEQEGGVRLVELMVRDHGIGIPTAYHSRIFGRFMRADNARERQIPGTGLGLYLCRELIERHGGRIWFESKEGEGAAFFVTLPLAGEPAGATPDASQAGHEAGAMAD
jgi:PAS domain S-box-containing protein